MRQRALLLEDLEGRLPYTIEEILRWASPLHPDPDIEVDEPEFLVANFVHGIKRLPAT